MSQTAATTPPAGGAAFSVARVLRLARKELRETLRDRRTIITLVLMPLLVYPVLSVALRQFLLSSSATAKQLPLRIATASQEELRGLAILLLQGDKLVHEHESAGASAPLSGGPILGANLGERELPLSENQIFALDPAVNETLEDLVRKNDIDLGVRLRPADADAARTELSFELVFRPNMPMSRQAASFVQRRFQAVIDNDYKERLAKKGTTALRARAGDCIRSLMSKGIRSGSARSCLWS